MRDGRRVRIHLSERDRVHGQPLRQAILSYLQRQGAAGATVVRGIEGFGARHQLHSNAIEVLMLDLPIVIEWVDDRETVDRLLPGLRRLLTDELVTVDSVAIVKWSRAALRPLSAGGTVAEVMARSVATVTPETPLRELAELLIDRAYRSLPVVDQSGRLVGIVTNGDLIERGGLGLRTELLHLLEPHAREAELRLLGTPPRTAGDVMTPQPQVVQPDTQLGAAAHRMVSHHLKRLPVVDSEGHLVGIVARVDILRGIARGAGEPVDEERTAPPSASPRVEDVMSRRVPAVAMNAPLEEVVRVVVSTRLNRAVVVDDRRRPIGVVSDAELLRRLDPRHRPGLAALLMRRLAFRHGTLEGMQQLRFEQGRRAADLMIAPAVTVRGTTPVAEAAGRMLARRYKILPVVDEQERLIGLVDRADLLRAVAGR